MTPSKLLGVCLLFVVVLSSAEARGDEKTKRIPVAQVQGDASFKDLLRKLAVFSKKRIGSIGGGPVMPGPDVLIAEQLTLMATRDQLKDLLATDNGAVRAHIAREIIRRRPAEVSLVRPLLSDKLRIKVGSMQDVPPIEDATLTIGELIQQELSIAGL